MKLIVKDKIKNKIRINKIIDWLIYMLGYSIIFTLVSFLFDSFYIDTSNYYIYSFISVVIIYLLNKTIKPLIVTLTIPLTALTLGLFYPLINLFILKLTDWILGSHFDLNNLFIALVVAILISALNALVDILIFKPLMRRLDNHG